MAKRPWRIGNGLAVVILWTGMIGIPVFLFHISRNGMTVGEHLHSAVLFLASQGLVFWLVARPSSSTSYTAALPPEPVGSAVTLPTPEPHVWPAEVVTVEQTDSLFGSGTPDPGCPVVQVTLANYIGSSRTRVIYLDPDGRQVMLRAGHEMVVTAAGRHSPPTIRVVESDLATQVCIMGATHVTVRLPKDSSYPVSAAARRVHGQEPG